jgi:rubrerythrin
MRKGADMDTRTEQRIKALEVALNNEAREREFYLKHRDRTANPHGKSMFGSIADDELEHFKRLQELHKRLKAEGKWPETIPIKVKGTEVKSILKKLIDAVDTSSKVDTDDVEGVKIAIAFETKGEIFYGELRDSVDNPIEKGFYDMLASLEREHRLSLEDTLEYFQNPEDWYTIKEKHHLDGA